MVHPQSLAIIVPTYGEAENLPVLLQRIRDTMLPTQRPYEVVVVDDNSPDNTPEVCEKLVAEGHPLRLIVRTEERGLSSAVLHGMRNAREADLLLCMDADLSHPPEALPAMCEALEQHPNVEFVIGSRYVSGGSTDENWGAFRWLNSKVATLLARPFTKVKDPMAGFFAMPERVFRRAENLNPCGYKIGLELLVKCRCREVAEVPIHFQDRLYGESKLTLKEQWNYLRHIKRLFDFKFGSLAQLGQFLMVGASGMFVDLLLMSVLLAFSLPFSVARIMAIFTAMSWNFYFNRRITFSSTRTENVMAQYAKFIATCSLGAAINWGVSVSLAHRVEFFEAYPLLAAVLGIVAGTFSNFLISKFWVFRKRKPAEATAETHRTNENLSRHTAS
ncbi:MAG: glycosyltransferase family 2 protein [Verrucomicrobiota bacterium JB022]|nr:glycosyltransferase family 2 protein [Verrucomicrobiota bacterium JB022]